MGDLLGDGTGRTPGETEGAYAAILAEVLEVDVVSRSAHFFDTLGADSLVMAHFCARVRKRTDLTPVSMKDIYQCPTIESLVAAHPAAAPPSAPPSVPQSEPVPAQPAAWRAAGSTAYVACAILQLLIFLGYCYVLALLTVAEYEWLDAAHGIGEVYLRAVECAAALLLFAFSVPVAAKWILIGRWRAEEIPLWSLRYVRFWLVKTLVQRNPLVLLISGSPLYAVYLRALGADIGRGVTIFTINVPVCTDLLVIGAGTVVRKDSSLQCYRARNGVIETGPVTLGAEVYVGEAAVIDINTSMGDHSQLGHSSSLLAGQSVPAGQSWHGTPGQRAGIDYRLVEPASCGSARRAFYSGTHLAAVVAVYLPLSIAGLSLLLRLPVVEGILDPSTPAFTSWAFYASALGASFVFWFGSLLVGLVVVGTVPRLLNLFLQPGRVYPLYGVHYSLHRSIERTSNLRVFPFLFGDSSFIVHYLRWCGYHLTPVQQTGSNFGQAVKHENPFLSSVGTGTMVADGLSIINADYSSTSFRLSPSRIGPHNFVGNRINYPPQGRTGADCLLATKSLVPVDGPIREGTGLLGAPSFEIPRRVDRDDDLRLRSEIELRERLSAKNRHNVITIAIYLLVRWMFLFGVTAIASAGFAAYPTRGAGAIAAADALVLLFSLAYFVVTERTVTHLRALKPQGCSIYDLDFWRHERFWKVTSAAYFVVLNGTPYKNLMWRLLGVRIGRRVFDDGCMMTERPFVTIGDECILNAGTTIQTHSQEDGAFKSDTVAIEARSTLGVGAFVHYGVHLGAGSTLGADCFLMKGEDVPGGSTWSGNPARPVAEEAGRAPTEWRPGGQHAQRRELDDRAVPGGVRR